MEFSRRSEILTIQIRWAALAVAAFMLEGRVSLLATLVMCAFVALYNLAVWYGASNSSRYERFGSIAGKIARGLDILVLGFAMLTPAVFASSLYLLFFIVIVQVAFVHQKRKLVALYCACCLAAIAASWAAQPAALRNPGALGKRLSIVSAGALLGFYIAAYKRQEDASRVRDKRLAALFDCSMRFVSGEEISRTLTHALRTAIGGTRATCGYIQIASETDKTLFQTEVALSKEGAFEFPEASVYGEGCIGYVAATGQPLLINSDDNDSSGRLQDPALQKSKAVICVPLLDRGHQIDAATEKRQEVLGVLTLLGQHPSSQFDEEDLDLTRTLASFVSMAAINARMYESLKGTFLSTLETLARSLEARDEYTRGHSTRVCEVSLMISREMGLRDDVIEEMRVGTLLHDIGKIGIRDVVLNKPGRLTDEEFEIMKQHPIIGWEICRPLGLSEGALMLIRNHHERLDGSGYPDNLKGGDLPLSLRIVCAADAFDAMSSRRPYREVMDEKLRIEQLNRFAGSQFDPVVVQTLKTLLMDRQLDDIYRDHWFDDPAEITMDEFREAA